jgi:hypothetical protein
LGQYRHLGLFEQQGRRSLPNPDVCDRWAALFLVVALLQVPSWRLNATGP